MFEKEEINRRPYRSLLGQTVRSGKAVEARGKPSSEVTRALL